jgi:hypothetical protein
MDWIVSSSSNVHVANHLDWFTTYTPFETYFGSIYSRDHRLDVLGIGTVTLDIKIQKNPQPGQPNSRTITLDDVLYAPGHIVCNILGLPICDKYELTLSLGRGGGSLSNLHTGAHVGIIDMPRLPRLALHGQPETSCLDPNKKFMINALWSDTERARWEAQKGTPVSSHTGGPLYTREEKAWLKTNYRGEYKFLREYGLSIHKEEDREEGRSIVRKFMANEERIEMEDVVEAGRSGPPPQTTNEDEMDLDDDDDEEDDDYMEDDDEIDDDDSDDESEIDGDELLRELRMDSDPMSRLADDNFSAAELKWIKKRYRYSSNFMLSHGLRPYDREDYAEARAVIKTMMRP